MSTPITVIGNLTNDPELRFTASGHAVTSFTVAMSDRRFDKATNEWVDTDPVFWRCSVWRQYAENVAESLTKGTRVIVTGKVKQREYETREGEKRTVMEVEVDDVGPALRFATARVTRVARDGGRGGHAATDDPWGSASAAAPAADPWGASNGQGVLDEAPF